MICLSALPLREEGLGGQIVRPEEETQMKRGRYTIDDGNAREKADTVERAVAIISGWCDHMRHDDPDFAGVDVPDFRGILEAKCGGGADLTVADLQDAIDEWIRQIVESKKLAFSGGEAELPLSVRDGDAQQERATTGRKMKKKEE